MWRLSANRRWRWSRGSRRRRSGSRRRAATARWHGGCGAAVRRWCYCMAATVRGCTGSAMCCRLSRRFRVIAPRSAGARRIGDAARAVDRCRAGRDHRRRARHRPAERRGAASGRVLVRRGHRRHRRGAAWRSAARLYRGRLERPRADRSPTALEKVPPEAGEEEEFATHRYNLNQLMIHDPAKIDELALYLQKTNHARARMRSRRFSRSGALVEALPQDHRASRRHLGRARCDCLPARRGAGAHPAQRSADGPLRGGPRRRPLGAVRGGRPVQRIDRRIRGRLRLGDGSLAAAIAPARPRRSTRPRRGGCRRAGRQRDWRA